MWLLALIACQTSGTVDFTPDTGGDTGVTDTGGGEDTAIEDTGPIDTGGICGEVSVHEMSLTGLVVDAGGDPEGGVDVVVQDRGWDPGTIVGSATTNAQGRYDMALPEVTSVEDCWGILLDYVLVGSKGGLTAERGINSPLRNAIVDESLSADITDVPLVLE